MIRSRKSLSIAAVGVAAVGTATLALALQLDARKPASPRTGSPAFASDDAAEKLKRVEAQAATISGASGKAPITFSLGDLMENFNVPAMSIAVIQHFQIVAAKAYGRPSYDAAAPATTHTLFLAGSISKPVTAAGALSMVEHGRLSLDTNVNDTLKSWKVPDNQFTATQKVTLRRILSHSAGLSVHGFAGYAVGEPIPTIVQVLNGEPPANSPPVRVEYVPG